MAEFANSSQAKKPSTPTKSAPQNTLSPPLIDAANAEYLTTGQVLHLQRTIGNAALQRVIAQKSTPHIQREDTSAPTAAASQYELNNFAHNDATLAGGHTEQIKKYGDEIKQTLTANPGATITIVGHTDATGTEAVNLKIGQSRANSVKEALVTAGVESERITAVLSQGKNNLKVHTDAKEGLNRRVEIKINGVSNNAPAPAPNPTPTPADTPNNDTPAPSPTPTPNTPNSPKEETETRLKPTAQILVVPYKYEVTYARYKDPKIKHKAVIEGELGIEYMLTKYDSGKLKLELPAEVVLGMLGAYAYKDQKFELKGEVKLGLGIKIKQTPFMGDIMKNVYFKQGAEISLAGDTSGAFSAGAEAKAGVGIKLGGPVKFELMGKGELEYNSKEEKLEGKVSAFGSVVVEF